MAPGPFPLARRLGARLAFTAAERAALDALQSRRRSFEAGRDIVNQGQACASAFILAEGWACSYRLLGDGTRQIVNFEVPGDFLGLRSLLFGVADHSVAPVTAIRVCEVSAADLDEAFAAAPRLAAAVLWAASCEEAVVAEHLVDVGRRSARVRTAHFLLELAARLHAVGLASPRGFRCPLSQYLLSDALGLSAVHLNRVLRQLREQGLLTFRHGEVVFDDLDGLMELTEFDMGFLASAPSPAG